MASVGTNLTWHEGINYAERKEYTKQPGLTIWFTGLSASGKSTIACELERQLLEKGVNSYRLDGDNIRMGLNNNLGFSEQDRVENIRRIGEVAKLFADSTAVAITSFISPYASDRNKARELHEKVGLPFLEVYVNVPVEVAEQRDPKGLYAKARRGEIKEFTGISAPYEAPTNPEIEVTHNDSVEESVQKVISYLREHKLVNL